ncbi:CBS domain-containing protein [Alteraurantiacibacter buctensis]|uniref:CBS domain-containing protein n=1 Tax=Alteraurantiacibacter buctensis TaxID=1503981 RepID=A0A844YWQ4_9SPHN|nr:CBS domain-containing protein [Alteraurantiacibacter buctensis]MXO70507.1 CBS domain-containing protein [Alteraurantiacibacter buctensis]
MSIRRIIEGRQQEIVSCSPQHSVRHAAGLLAERRIGAMPVLDGGQVAGIFSERDLLYCVAKEGEAALARPVAEVMTAPAITIEPQVEVMTALSLMTRRRIRHLPVVEAGRLLGFVSIGDLVKYRIESIEAEAQQMREYITLA